MFKKKQQVEVRRPTILDVSRKYWIGGFFKDLKERYEHQGEKVRVDLYQKYMTVAWDSSESVRQ